MQKIMGLLAFAFSLILINCSGISSKNSEDSAANSETDTSGAVASTPTFDADSAYQYLKRQVEFGPRVPNSPAHAQTADWLSYELKRHGAEITEQKATLTAFDGTQLQMRNIFGSFNPDATDRLLLLAHYDTRPWADQDSDPAAHKTPIDGANDGASGVAVLLETARLIGTNNPNVGIDILFSDVEDYGTDGNEDSWAMGTRYFAEHPIREGYSPSGAILLDMVGGKNAVFPAEYFSREAAPGLDDAFRAAARRVGHGDMFPTVYGGAVTDDHVELIKRGIPAIDIIDYRPESGFNPTWHTLRDNLDNIDRNTLKAVGETLIEYIYSR